MLTQFLRNCLHGATVLSLLVTLIWPAQMQAATLPSSAETVTRLTYDPNGNLLTRTDANGVTSQYEYDALDRVVAISYPDGSSVRYSYDAAGQVSEMEDALGTTRYKYDIHGRLTSVADPNGYTIKYEYNRRGFLSKLIYPDGGAVSYAWDADGQLTSVGNTVGTTSYGYDEGGRLIKRTLPNGVTSHYQYDDANRLSEICHIDPNDLLLLGFAYRFDAVGNATQMTRLEAGRPPQVTDYQYDALYRLTQVRYPSGEVVSYTYDAVSNRTLMDSSTHGATHYTYNNLGQLVQLEGPEGTETFDYDANGNLVKRRKPSGQVVRYIWDYENRLIGVEDGATTVQFGYDGNNWRLRKTVNGRAVEYVQHGDLLPQVILTRDGQETIRSLLGFTTLGEFQNRESAYYLEDRLGSVAGITNGDGKLLKALDYDVFGLPHEEVAAIGFTGEQFDSETGLIFLRARYYDPRLGRYISADPFRGFIDEPQSQNRYTYTLNNPVNLTDPQGLCVTRSRFIGCVTSTIGIIGGTIGMFASAPIMATPIGAYAFTQSGLQYVSSISDLSNAIYGEGALPKVPGGVAELGLGRFWGETGAKFGQIVDLYTGLHLNQALGKLIEPIVSVSMSVSIMNFADRFIIIHTTRIRSLNIVNSGIKHLSDVWQYVDAGAGIVKAWMDVAKEWKKAFPSNQNQSGGSGAAVGGVLLDRSAEVLTDLNNITGVAYDPATGQLVLIGEKNLALPPMNLDDLVVAIRSVYAGQDPGVTMVPVDPTWQDPTQRVEYFGQTPNTHFGYVMFEADRYLKSLAGGQDSLTGEPLKPNVPGFKSELQLTVEQRTEVPWHRNWFVPGEIVLKQSADGRSMLFDRATMRVESHFVEFARDGSMKDVLGSSPVTDRFTTFLTENYDAFAAEKPELRELVQLAKIVGIVKWLRDNDIPVDLSWVNDYEVAFVETPMTTPGVSASSAGLGYVVTSMGGVDFSTNNSYTIAPEVDAYRAPAIASRPVAQPAVWDFTVDGETYQAVALNVAPSELVGGYAATITDLAMRVTGGLVAELTRFYNSANLASGPMGPGWTITPYSLQVQEVWKPAGDERYTVKNEYALLVGAAREEFSGPYHYDAQPDQEFLLPARQPSIYRDILLQPEGYVLRRTDGLRVEFDASDRLQAIADANGNRIQYTYDARDRLTAIVDAEQRGLAFTYTGDRLTQATASDGRAVVYGYDDAGRLASVTDQTEALLARYEYDDADRVARIFDGSGRLLVENRYDGLGRVTVTGADPNGTVGVEYDRQTNGVTFTDSQGHQFKRQYNDKHQLITESDPFDNTVRFEYDEADRLASVIDKKGNASQYTYNQAGFIANITLPLDGQTRLMNYTETGAPEIVIDPADRITFLDYDDQGRLTRVKRGSRLTAMSADGGFTYQDENPLTMSYEYDVTGNLATVTDADDYATHFTYDAVGNLTHIQQPGGSEIVYTYDKYSQPTSVTYPSGYEVNMTYDDQGRLLDVATAAGSIGYEYADGRLAAIVDPLANRTEYTYDERGALTAVTVANKAVTRYEYDTDDNLAAVIDAEGGRIEYEYDALGRPVAERRIGRSSSLRYDSGVGNGPEQVTPNASPQDNGSSRGNGDGGDATATETPKQNRAVAQATVQPSEPTVAATTTATQNRTAAPTSTRTIRQTPTPMSNTARTATPEATPYISIQDGLVDLRKIPDLAVEAAAQIGPGIDFRVAERTDDGRWLRICCVGTSGFWVLAEDVVVHNDIEVAPISAGTKPVNSAATAEAPEDTPTPSNTPTPSATPTPTNTPTATATAYAVAETDLVELRRGPDAAYPLALSIGPDFPLDVVGRNVDASWFLVCCVNDQELWVEATTITVYNDPDGIPLITPPPTLTPTTTATFTPSPTPTATSTPGPTPFAQAIGGKAMLREGPAESFPVAAEIGTGLKLAVVGRTADSRWLQVCCIATSSFWVNAAQVKIGNDVATAPELTPPPTPTPVPSKTPTRTPTPSPTPRVTDLTHRTTVSASSAAPDGKDTCTPPGVTSFVATNLVDDNTNTAWRVAGSAADSYIDFHFDEPVVLQEMRIVPGYAKTDPCDATIYWCPINRIPKRVQLTFDDNVKVEFMLEERCEQQRVTWQPLTTQSVRLQVLETYAPSSTRLQRDYTPISEVELWGYQP